MLTFFEYLRQRAFESVLAGAHEALDFLERQQTLAETGNRLPKPSESADGSSPKPPRKREDNVVPLKSKVDGQTKVDGPLLNNREVGRPPNQQKGKK